jgi:exodeoxyribonuclease V alpha subunit
VGLIRENEKGELMACFESVNEEGVTELKKVPPAYINACTTVFAMTIHKSQGSEFERVVVVLPEKEQMAILTRELLYTAVTRAREHVLLIGGKEVINAAVERKVSRASGIRDRIINEEV